MHYINQIADRAAQDLARLVQQDGLNTATVILRWRSSDAVSAAADPLLVSHHVPSDTTEHSREIKALVHYVDHSQSTYSAHKEVATGDVILDFPNTVEPLEGLNDLRFEIAGVSYVAKKIGKALRDSWDLAGKNRTLLLTRQP